MRNGLITSMQVSPYYYTVDAGYKHIVGNCINVFITGMFL